jgi:hypothetical protein
MSHVEERVNGARIRNKSERAPPHWLNPLGSVFWSVPGAESRMTVNFANPGRPSSTATSSRFD